MRKLLLCCALLCSFGVFADTYMIQMSRLDIPDVKNAPTQTFTSGDVTFFVNNSNNGKGGYGFYKEDTEDFRLYARCVLTLSCEKAKITSVDFSISEAGKKKLAEITTNVGSCKTTKNPSVTWTGSENSISFTVGDDATYGTKSGDGQFFFTHVTITTDKPISVGKGEAQEVPCPNCNYEKEPWNQVLFDVDMDTAVVYPDADGAYLYMYSEQYEARLYYFGDLDGGQIPVGTYTIDDGESDGTFLASPGGDENDDYPSVFLAGANAAPFYLVEGTVKITSTGDSRKIEIDASSYNGSEVKLTYDGIVATRLNKIECLTSVYGLDGRIFADEVVTIFNLQGQDVTLQNGNLQNGVYIVRSANKVTKVVLK